MGQRALQATGLGQSCTRVKARTLATPACAWVVSNECTAATVAPHHVWRQRAPHSLLRAGHHCSAAPYREPARGHERRRACGDSSLHWHPCRPLEWPSDASGASGRQHRSPHPKRSNCAGRMLQPRGGARNRRQGPLSSGRAAHAPRAVLANSQCPARTSARGVSPSQSAASKSYDKLWTG